MKVQISIYHNSLSFDAIHRIDTGNETIGFAHTTDQINPKTLNNALEMHGIKPVEHEQDLENNNIYLLVLPKPVNIVDSEHTIHLYYK